MKRVVVASVLTVSFLVGLCFVVFDVRSYNADKTFVVDKKVENEKQEYETLIYCQGKYYHYGRQNTTIQPENKLGTIKDAVSEGIIPKEEMTANSESYIGMEVYQNLGEEGIYLKETEGEYIYFEEGIVKKGELEVEDMGPSYVAHQGKAFSVSEKQKSLPEGYEETGVVHTWTHYCLVKEGYTNIDELYKGRIYSSQQEPRNIYVENTEGSFTKCIQYENGQF